MRGSSMIQRKIMGGSDAFQVLLPIIQVDIAPFHDE